VGALRTDRAVVLNGPTGSGKSITAYHALRRIADDGFEPLRLRDDARGRGLGTWLVDLAAFPRPKVLLVDDAQNMSPDTVRELAERADADTLVLVVGIDPVSGGVRTVRLSAHAAVARLAWWVRQERPWVFPLVHALDNQVGAHPNDLFFDRRVDIAERQRTPWQFLLRVDGRLASGASGRTGTPRPGPRRLGPARGRDCSDRRRRFRRATRVAHAAGGAARPG
jgi:hypothetical protein